MRFLSKSHRAPPAVKLWFGILLLFLLLLVNIVRVGKEKRLEFNMKYCTQVKNEQEKFL